MATPSMKGLEQAKQIEAILLGQHFGDADAAGQEFREFNKNPKFPNGTPHFEKMVNWPDWVIEKIHKAVTAKYPLPPEGQQTPDSSSLRPSGSTQSAPQAQSNVEGLPGKRDGSLGLLISMDNTLKLVLAELVKLNTNIESRRGQK